MGEIAKRKKSVTTFPRLPYNLPSTTFRKFACADDLALLHSSGN